MSREGGQGQLMLGLGSASSIGDCLNHQVVLQGQTLAFGDIQERPKSKTTKVLGGL